MKIDFADLTFERTFDADLFFNYHAFSQENIYRPFIRENEDLLMSGTCGGPYSGAAYDRAPRFGMVIRSTAANEQELYQ